MQLATDEQAKSARRWAWIGLGLAVLDAGMFVKSVSHFSRFAIVLANPEVATLVKESCKTLKQIAQDLRMSEKQLVAELKPCEDRPGRTCFKQRHSYNLGTQRHRANRIATGRAAQVAEVKLHSKPGEAMAVLKPISSSTPANS